MTEDRLAPLPDPFAVEDPREVLRRNIRPGLKTTFRLEWQGRHIFPDLPADLQAQLGDWLTDVQRWLIEHEPQA